MMIRRLFFSYYNQDKQLQALRSLDIKKVKKLIKNGMDINKIFYDNGNSLSPLHYAVQCCGHTELLKYLLEQDNIDIDVPDSHGETPLMYAAKAGECHACLLLIEHGADYKLKSPRLQMNTIELFKSSVYKFLTDTVEEAIRKRESLTENNSQTNFPVNIEISHSCSP